MDASCEAPRTCTVCGKTEGEALGHTWMDASCENPKICTVCRHTEGEALGHNFEMWTVMEEDMYRVCDYCSYEERSEIDREVLLRQELAGHWRFACFVWNGVFDQRDFEEGVEFNFDFLEDGSAVFYGGGEAYEGHWEFDNYAVGENGEDLYGAYFLVDGIENTGYWFWLQLEEAGYYSMIVPIDTESGEAYYTLLKSSMLAGCWEAEVDGKVYSLNLCEDGTFTGDMDGMVSGQWSQGVSDDWWVEAVLLLKYDQEGISLPSVFELSFSSDTPWSGTIYEAGGRGSFTPDWGASGLNYPVYDHFTEWNFEPSRKAGTFRSDAWWDEGQKIPGTWVSKNVRYDYTLTVREDGTFTAMLDEEFSGTVRYKWGEFEKWDGGFYDGVPHEDIRRISCYEVYAEDQYLLDYEHSVDNQCDDKLVLYNGLKRITFVPEEEKEAYQQVAALPVGTWTVQAVNGDSPENWLGGTITFCEDGTFTSSLDVQFSGDWTIDTDDPFSGRYYYVMEDSSRRHFRIDDGTMQLSLGFDVIGTVESVKLTLIK